MSGGRGELRIPSAVDLGGDGTALPKHRRFGSRREVVSYSVRPERQGCALKGRISGGKARNFRDTSVDAQVRGAPGPTRQLRRWQLLRARRGHRHRFMAGPGLMRGAAAGLKAKLRAWRRRGLQGDCAPTGRSTSLGVPLAFWWSGPEMLWNGVDAGLHDLTGAPPNLHYGRRGFSTHLYSDRQRTQW